jgi:hypothetical protein
VYGAVRCSLFPHSNYTQSSEKYIKVLDLKKVRTFLVSLEEKCRKLLFYCTSEGIISLLNISKDGTEIRKLAGRPRKWGSIPGRSKKLFSSP